VVDACRGCAVVDLCLRYALASHERDGVWGATTPEERAALLAAQPTTAA
jgi:WhiB family redox-sensing transcriptional regulator